MLKKILGTIGTRYLVAFLNLALIFVNAKVLGLEGVGLIGILVASVNIVVIVCGILSGNTLVYFMNRYAVRTLFPLAYGWSLAGSVIACGIMQLTGLIPDSYFMAVYTLAILNSFVTANTRFLLGKDRIKAFNITYLLQGGLLFFVLLYFYFVRKEATVESYIRGSYIVNGIAFVVSLIWVYPYLKEKKDISPSLFSVLKEMFVYGLWASADNLAENLITRINYFLIQRFGGLGSVGLLDAGTKVSESVWHISRSVSLMEYNSVAKTSDLKEQKRITISFFKFTFCALTLVMAGILCVPEWIYTDFLFSAEFQGVRQIIIALSIGIVAFGSNNILSHFFIGSGRIRYSAYCSGIGLVALLLAGSFFIPRYGVTGAAASTSIAFSVMLFFSLSVFTRQTATRLRAFIPGRSDWQYLQNLLQHRKKSNSEK